MHLSNSYIVSVRTSKMICIELRHDEAIDCLEQIIDEIMALTLIDSSGIHEVYFLDRNHWFECQYIDGNVAVKQLERLHAEYIEETILENCVVDAPRGYLEEVNPWNNKYWQQMQTYLATQELPKGKLPGLLNELVTNANDTAKRFHDGETSAAQFLKAVSCIVIAKIMCPSMPNYLSTRLGNNPKQLEELLRFHPLASKVWSLMTPRSEWETGFLDGINNNPHFIELINFSHNLDHAVTKDERVSALTHYIREHNHVCPIEPLRKMQLL